MGILNITKSTIIRYFIELILIVVGITLSIYLNEWINQKNEETLSQEILKDIKKDFIQDSLNLANQIEGNNQYILSFNRLLNAKNFATIKDSMSIILDHLISYVKHREQSTTFYSLIQNNQTRLIRDKSLLRSIIEYHTNQKKFIESWNKIDEDFVLNRMIPKYEMTIPHYADVINGKRNSKQAFDQIKKDPHFMNLIQSSILFKTTVQQILKQNLYSIRLILSRIK